MAAMVPDLWSEESGYEPWSCRRRLTRYTGNSIGAGFAQNPLDAGIVSYHQPAAMFTDPLLWRADGQERRQDASEWARRVPLHEFTFPSQKVSMSELFAMHGNQQPASGMPDALNAAFVDGHARVVRPADAARASTFEGQPAGFPEYELDFGTVPLAFNSVDDGARGINFR